ncbi:MAG: cobalt-precorrin-6A reductase [Corynebacterium sp.]|nr:cobalt-precorrin-6A reductase [Corynebacterium sp.]
MRALILGGTKEGHYLAQQLHKHGDWVMTSFAGRVRDLKIPEGEYRVGGFGGPDGLKAWIKENNVDVVIDATHPYAERISASASQACEQLRIPLYRLERPLWEQSPEDMWIHVDSMADAAQYLQGHPVEGSVFLTIGRQQLSHFSQDSHHHFLIRCVEPPAPEDLPASYELILDRGPYTVENERALIAAHNIGLIVTKNSGSAATFAKIEAARKIGTPVLMVSRPRSELTYGTRISHCCQVLAQFGYSAESD